MIRKFEFFFNFRLIFITICLGQIFLNGCVVKQQTIKQSKTGEIIFYVSPDGDNNWSGTLSTPDMLRKDGPFATLQYARDVIRKVKAGGVNGRFTVLVRGGTYRLNETFSLGPDDSGTESQPVIFKAYENERPILSGSKTVSNFKYYKGNILKADLKGTPLDSCNFRQLFADGKRQTLSRFPNYDPRDPISGGFLYVQDVLEKDSNSKFKYTNVSLHEWANPQDGEVFIYPGPNYWNDIIPIAEIDKNHQIIRLTNDASYAIERGNRYFFQNILEEIDSPTEWYFDRCMKVLYFWPPSEDSLKNITAPYLKTILEIKGINDKEFPAHIKLEGFVFEECDGNAVVISEARNIVIAKSTISNAGGNGIEVHGGYKNVIIGNDVYAVGGAGLIVSGGNRKTLRPAGNKAENNYIHHTGIFNKASSGIECSGVGNSISHNLVHTTPRSGITFDGNDHIIEYNHVHNVNRETQDSGIIYSCTRDWTKRGNIVRFNYIHDSGGFGRDSAKEKWQSPYYTWGIYIDDWTSGTTVYGNIVARTFFGGIDIHGGKDNIIENNIIIEGLREQVRYQAISSKNPLLLAMFNRIKEIGYLKYPQLSMIKDAKKDATMSGNQFLRNIIYYTEKKAVLYNIVGDIDPLTIISDYNTIYHSEMPILISNISTQLDNQWQVWKAKGLDQHSIIADPLFRDINHGDFRLSPDSPALTLGFKHIPLEKIGPYKDTLRASWPVSVSDEN